jgi:hypothetical protein
MANHASSIQVVTLEEAREQFTTWRSQPHRVRRIPEELWDTAVSLCREHSICKVSRILRLDYNALKERIQRSGSSPSRRPFVELGNLLPQTGVFVECNDGARHQMRVHCTGPIDACVVDLVKAFFGTGR